MNWTHLVYGFPFLHVGIKKIFKRKVRMHLLILFAHAKSYDNWRKIDYSKNVVPQQHNQLP